jgi:hypothetical protein
VRIITEEAMPKRSKNLSLDPEAVRRGERYSELHSTNVSQLVSNFLSSLPLEEEEQEERLSPAVRRLLGIASEVGVDDYSRYLVDRYGQ